MVLLRRVALATLVLAGVLSLSDHRKRLVDGAIAGVGSDGNLRTVTTIFDGHRRIGRLRTVYPSGSRNGL